MKRRHFAGAGVAALAAAAAGPAWAEARIPGDVRFFCGFPPGGNADLLCRILAEGLKPDIGQNVIVESKAGASGFIANETVANAVPDGRTIGLAAMAAMCVSPVMPGQKLPINVDTDLTPRLGEIKCPTLLLHPDGSPFIPVPVMAALHQLLPTSQLNVLGHSRHGLPFSHAAQCAQILRSFLDSQAVG